MITRRRFLAATGSGLVAPCLLRAQGDVQAAIARLGRPLRLLVPDGSQDNVLALIAAFEATTGCATEMIVVDLDDINATLALESILPDLHVDVAFPATFGIPDLVDSGAIRPLDDLAGSEGAADRDQGLLYRAGDRYDGRLWGYQTDGDVYLMFYNRDLLEDPAVRAAYADRFGMSLGVPQTWEELDRQMAFMHRADGTRFGGCLFRTATYAAWEWWGRFHAAGGVPFTDEFTPAISGDAGEAALEAMLQSAAHLTGQTLGLFENWARFDVGDIYANIGWGGTQKFLNKPGANMRGRIANGPLPGGTRNGEVVPMAYFNWGWSVVIAAQCPEPDLAYMFCRMAMDPGPSSDAVAAVDGYFDPFHDEHYRDPRIVDAYGEDFLKYHKAAMTKPLPDLYVGRRGEYFDNLTFWLLRVLDRDVAPDVALRNISTAWDITTDIIGREKQAARWAAVRKSYPDSVRGLAKPD